MELEPLQSLSTDFLSLLSNGDHGMMSDVTFCIEGRQLHAHRCILAARCPFFRLMFSHDKLDINGTTPLSEAATSNSAGGICTSLPNNPSPAPSNLVIPVDVVGFNVFFILLRFLYSGQLLVSEVTRDACTHTACSHSSCSAVVDLLLEVVHASKFFGVDQLLDLAQAKLGHALEDGMSVQSLMKVLVAAKKQKLHRVWSMCVDLVMSAGLSCDVLRSYLPRDFLNELAAVQLRGSGYAFPSNYMQGNLSNPSNHQPYHHNEHIISSPISCNANLHVHASHGACSCTEEQKILRLQQALDCMDVELVRLMVMGEGLDLDKAMALHYAVANCNREVVKALLELGYVDVNYADALGHTALHLASEMGNADMIAVLLDHHADPNALTNDGLAAVDIVRSLVKTPHHDNSAHVEHHHNGAITAAPLCKADQKRILLCIELLHSASAVAGRVEEAAESSCISQADQKKGQAISTQAHQETPVSAIPLTRVDRQPPPAAIIANQEAAVGDQPMTNGALTMEDQSLIHGHHHHHPLVAMHSASYAYLLGCPAPYPQHVHNVHSLSESSAIESQSRDGSKTMSSTAGTTPPI